MTEEDVRKVFSHNLRRLRIRSGLSQMRLGERIGLATNFINDIENGKKWVSPESIAKFATEFDIEPYQLFLPVEHLVNKNRELLNSLIADVNKEVCESIQRVKDRYIIEE